MDEQTVNEDTLFDPSDFEDQEVEQSENTDGPAVEETKEEQTTSQDNEATESAEVSETKETETQTGDAIDDFLAKKGVDPSDPQAVRKIAEMYQNVEKGFYQKSQEKAKLSQRSTNTEYPRYASTLRSESIENPDGSREMEG